jgi:hypothetical protein
MLRLLFAAGLAIIATAVPPAASVLHRLLTAAYESCSGSGGQQGDTNDSDRFCG